MRWLSQHAWWGLALFAIVFVLFGLTDIASGAAADPAIPRGLTGRTIAELEAESPAAYQMFDFLTRINGWSLVLIGALLTVIVFIPFRGGERWAWWTMWAVPVWSIGVALFYVVVGTRPDQPPPPPMVSGPIVAALSVAILLVSRPRTSG
jgi:hypothetical protein